MSSQTRIVILKMRNVIYTGIFIFLILVLGVLLFLMFGNQTENTEDNLSPQSSVSGNSAAAASAGQTKADNPLYCPGCYHSVMKIGDDSVHVNVTVNADHIESVSLSDLSEEVSKAYPLLEPAMKNLNEQIVSTQSTKHLTFDKNMQYTQTALIDTINTALKKASLSN